MKELADFQMCGFGESPSHADAMIVSLYDQ